MRSNLPFLPAAVSGLRRALLGGVLGSRFLVGRLGRGRLALAASHTLDPQVAALLGLADLVGAADVTRRTPARARQQMVSDILVVEEPPPRMVTGTADASVAGPQGAVPVRVYTPAGVDDPSPAVVYLHGGGWVLGSIDTHDGLCRRLAHGAGCRVVSVDYRLAPEHPFPAAVHDALAAFRWVAKSASELGIDPERIAIAGDSAGGNLAALVALRTREDAPRPALQVLLYPGTDMTRSRPSHASLGEGYFLTRQAMDWYLDCYMAGADRADPAASPLFAPDLRGAAPALVYTAGFDPLRDEGRDYAERLRQAGVTVRHVEHASLVHGFAQMTRLHTARRAVEEMVLDVGRALR